MRILLITAIICFASTAFALEDSTEEIKAFKAVIAVPEGCKEVYGEPNCVSSREQYLEGFRRGFWRYVRGFPQDSHYNYSRSDRSYAVGWMCRVRGWADGYDTAHKEVQENIKEFGIEKTHAKHKGIWDRITGP